MNRTEVILTLNLDKPVPDFPTVVKHEREIIDKWKADGILESFFLRQERNGAVLIFKDIEEPAVRELIAGLPLFPYMKSAEYLGLVKQF